MTVTVTVESSISISFENVPKGCSLTGAGTNAATLNLGTVSPAGAANACVNHSVTGTDYTVDTLFGVKVVKANNGSATYTLAAALVNADAANQWKIDSKNLSTTAVNLDTNAAYGSVQSKRLKLRIPQSTAPGVITNTIAFTATSN
jgi:hypothetical protein